MKDTRDEIAKIIGGVAFRPKHINGPFESETEKEKWLRARNVAYYQTDCILAELEKRATPKKKSRKVIISSPLAPAYRKGKRSKRKGI